MNIDGKKLNGSVFLSFFGIFKGNLKENQQLVIKWFYKTYVHEMEYIEEFQMMPSLH